MMHFDEWWNSAAADSFRAKHEDLDGEVFRTVWDAVQLGQAAIKKAQLRHRLAAYDAAAKAREMELLAVIEDLERLIPLINRGGTP